MREASNGGKRPADLAAVVREAHSKAMEALAADVHPYSGPVIRDWEQEHDAALDALLALVEEEHKNAEELSTPRTRKCDDCDGLGVQAGAHTERVEPCPACDGSGRKKVEAAG